MSVKGPRLQECVSGRESVQYNIHHWYSKDRNDGAGN